ncbi:hypothetical protein D9757_005161 [Collybiopsis confluens]|uniref:SHSP domain-containing protein n=1 Tax=Collybiopsis confluens TaxID=2823264 RepID=A0A8H5HSW3_9AGAR|nr:hypothetical protein D9757_005161 [Collybiopsis confluens]
MSFYYYEPNYHFDRLFDNRDLSGSRRLLQGDGSQNQTLTERSTSDISRFLKPNMDLHEDKDKNIVTATFEFPGIKKEDIQIDMQNGRLTVAAETKQSEVRDQDGYAVRERRFGKFSRTLQLPQGVKEEDIKAAMENGVLTVTFPKAAAEKAAKKITIS